jgi:hypothetical protein
LDDASEQISREYVMPASAKVLKAMNDETQRIPIGEDRWRELAVELNQLRAAAEAALAVHDFDRDPAEFAALLRSRRA